jgi:hypothetical protein
MENSQLPLALNEPSLNSSGWEGGLESTHLPTPLADPVLHRELSFLGSAVSRH